LRNPDFHDKTGDVALPEIFDPNASDCSCNYMALTEHWANMLSNREKDGFNADSLVPGLSDNLGPKVGQSLVNIRPPRVRFGRRGEASTASGGKAI
jgi:hypothetical protein